MSWRAVKPMRRYGDLSISQDGAATILNLQIFIILTVGTLKRFTLHYLAKFLGDRSNFREDMPIFPFSNMAAFRLLGFVMRVFGPPTKDIWWSLTLYKVWLESMQ